MDGIYANLRRLLRRWSHDARRPMRRHGRLHVEQLEERRVPTVTHTYIVTTTAYTTDTSHLSFNSKGDAYNTNGAPVSLFEALTAINTVNARTGQYVYAGSGVIDFDVAGSGVHVFALPSGTANPTEVVAQSDTTINGYTQPGASPNTSTGTSDNAHVDVQFNFAVDVKGSSTVIQGIALPAVALGTGQANEVLGDFVGVTPGGASMSSSLTGVTIGTVSSTSSKATTHATHDTVGTAAAANRNVISGHLGTAGYGVAIVDGSSDNSVQNNLVGTNLAGTAALSNAAAGVYFDASATSANAITGNIIAFNHGDGIQMAGGSGATLSGNAVYANAAGIVLAATANSGIAAPVFTHWNPTTVTGELTKFTAGATYTLNFYNNTQTDSAGHYEGQTPWATVKVVPNSQGDFTASVAEPVSGGLTATVTDAKGDTSAFSAATDFNISSASGPTLQLVEGTPATNFLVGTIVRDGNPNTNISQLQAVVAWGDGSQATLTSQPSAAGQIIAGPSGTFLVRGSHTYAKAGSYHITATVTDRATYASNSTIDTAVQVADAPLSSTSVAINPVAETAFQGEVATFTELNPNVTTKQFTATINWGDGTTSTGTVTLATSTASGATYDVSGSHTYGTASQYVLAVTVTDADGGTTKTSRSTTVAFGAMTPDGTAISATEGTPFTGTIGTFAAPGASSTSQYTAVITWGNGQTTTASTATDTILGVPGGAGSVPGSPAPIPAYYITGTSTYVAAGTYPVSIVVTGPASTTATIDSTANVADAALSSTSLAVNPVEQVPFQGAIATFTEQNPSATAGQFTATINWGDGTTTTGTVTAAPSTQTGATFNVNGNHTYAVAGVYAATVTITDADGGTTTATLNVTVADAPLNPQASTFTATAGTAFTGIIGSFTDPGANGSSQYTAVITWGNGQTSTASSAAGTIVAGVPAAQFLITGTNTYATAGTYPVSIVVTDSGGATTTISSTADVAVPPLTGTAVSLVAVAGTTFTLPVATFTDAAGPQPLGAYTATIDWGDGTPTSSGVITLNGNTFTVTGSHTYANSGTPIITVQLTDTAGATLTLTLQTSVAAPV